MGGDHSIPSSMLGYDKHGVPCRWFELARELHSLFLWEGHFWDFVLVGRALLGLGVIVTDGSWRCDTTLEFPACF